MPTVRRSRSDALKHWHETAAVLARAGELAKAGVSTALATVVRLDGSGYRRPGAKLLIAPDEAFGGVSGGCLEADVREVGLAVLADGVARTRRYDTREGDANPFGLGLGCDGVVDVFVRRLDVGGAAWVEARRLLEGEAAFAICTRLSGEDAGRSEVVTADAAGTEVARALAAGRSTVGEDGAVFVDVLTPPPRLVVVGGGDDARALVACAAAVGLRVTVVDHRPAFATAARFAGAQRVVVRRPDGGVGDLVGGAPAAAVVMTHALGLDREWLRRLLATDVAYVGLLGARSRAAGLLEAVGADARVFGPVGLDVGADGPEEIAVSVVAEVLAALRGRPAGHLRVAGPQVAGIVLAAGSSARMGARNKLLMMVEGEALVRRAARRALAAGLSPVVVVVGHEAGRVASALAGLDVEVVHNERYVDGAGSSLARGMAAVADSEASAVVVTLADMPWVTEAMVEEVVARRRATGAPLVVSDYGGVSAPPMLYERALFAELSALDGERAGAAVVQRHRARAAVVAQPVEALRDVDTPEDLATLG